MTQEYIELLKKSGIRKTIILNNDNIYCYFQRCTLEGKGAFNYGRPVHYVERIAAINELDEIKQMCPHSTVTEMYDGKIKKWIYEKVDELEHLN